MTSRLRLDVDYDVADLLKTQPKQMRALWRNVTGERMWYALQGYDVKAQPTERGMFGAESAVFRSSGSSNSYA